MSPREKPLLEPVRVRDGAAYQCFGDGLCCTDIHGLGPMTLVELRTVKKIDKAGAAYDDDFEDYMLRTVADGGCHFLLPNQWCSIHANQGPLHKPHGCQKFPWGFTATPTGGRVHTEHRCPCRTLGDRPLLTAERALESLRERDGSLDSDCDIDSVKLDSRRTIPFRRWEALEAPILSALANGVDPADALSATPFPKLSGSTWPKVADEFIGARDGSRFGFALAWFGDTILHLVQGKSPREPMRPWSEAFDRAEARSPTPRTPREVLNDFVADHLYAVKWAGDVGYAKFAAEMATRVAIAESVASRLMARGLRPDRAMAEAVMIVEIVGASEHWETLVPTMRP